MYDRISHENKSNIKLWESLGKSDPLWGVLTHRNKRHSKWDKQEFYLTGSHEIKNLLKELKLANSLNCIKNVLDFGCGVGRLTRHISKYFTNVVAIDISKNMLKNAVINNQTIKNILFIHYNDAQITFIKESSIDLIVSIITFQHIPPQIQVKYLQDFSRILRREGLIYVQLVHGFQNNLKGFLLRIFGNSILRFSHKFKYKLYYPMKIYPLREKSFKQFVSNNNLEIIHKNNSGTTGTAFRSYTYLLRVNK